MPDTENLKIFISWSGRFAREVAVILRDWLPNLSDLVVPWASDVDIAAGTRSMDELASELVDTQFGIIVVTQDNQRAPWLNFEAGALSKQVNGVKARVAPLLMDMKTPTDLTGPLSQYQANVFKRSGMEKIVQSIGTAAGVDPKMMQSRFQKYWPDLERDVDAVRSRLSEHEPVAPQRSQMELVDETLRRVRSMERQIEDLSARWSSGEGQRRGSRPAHPSQMVQATIMKTGIERFAVQPNEIVALAEGVDEDELLDLREKLRLLEPRKQLILLSRPEYEEYSAKFFPRSV